MMHPFTEDFKINVEYNSSQKKRLKKALFLIIGLNIILPIFFLWNAGQSKNHITEDFIMHIEADDSFDFISTIFQDVYFWKNEVDFDHESQDSLMDLFISFRHPEDKNSQLLSVEAFNNAHYYGEYRNFGFSFIENDRGNWMVQEVFDNSFLRNNGIFRGTEILGIDGLSREDGKISPFTLSYYPESDSLDVEFLLSDGTVKVMTLPIQLHRRAEGMWRTFPSKNNGVIGYVNIPQLIFDNGEVYADLFEGVRREGADDIIVDLRGNHGVDIKAAFLLTLFLFTPEEREILFFDMEHKYILKIFQEEFNFNLSSRSLNGDIVFLVSEEMGSAASVLVNLVDRYSERDIYFIGGVITLHNQGINPYKYNDWVLLLEVPKREIYYQLGYIMEEKQPHLPMEDLCSYDWADPEDPIIRAALNLLND